MSVKLRKLIRSVRGCKTAAEERTVIKNECALIRASFRENQDDVRARNVAKCLYIHMYESACLLGYPTHFAQMECIKLIASSKFSDKRVGYLALIIMLQEKDEVLMLSTNSLKVDLNGHNRFQVGLALTALGNLGTADMCRDLVMEVDKHLKDGHATLRKKAALCAVRILKKCPELVDDFTGRIVALLKERSYSILITGIQLAITVLEIDPAQCEVFFCLVPGLVRLLRGLLSGGLSLEHDVNCVTDPFLQVKILRLLRLLGRQNAEAVEEMSDVLAQVATDTETANNAGNAILYECTRTIMSIEAESGHKLLAINILGRFILNRDNNLRYVALTTLGEVVHHDLASVQRHRNTIVNCLKDPDVSIRQRAVELMLQLVNASNVVELTSELLEHMTIVSAERRGDLASDIFGVIEQFAPSKRWRMEALISLLSLANNDCDASLPNSAIIYASQSPELHPWVVHKTFSLLQKDLSHPALTLVGIWCIGEYGEHLFETYVDTGGDSLDMESYSGLTQDDVIELLSTVLNAHNSSNDIKAYTLVALAKFATKCTPERAAQIKDLLQSLEKSMVLELQARSCEFKLLLGPEMDSYREKMLEKMPTLDENIMKERRARYKVDNNDSDAYTGGDGGINNANRNRESRNADGTITETDGGVDLLGLNLSSEKATEIDVGGGGGMEMAGVASTSPVDAHAGGLDLLANIFRTSSNESNTSAKHIAPEASSNTNTDLLEPNLLVKSGPSFLAMSEKGLEIWFDLSKPKPNNPAITQICARFLNKTKKPISGIHFQAAVPKYMTMSLQQATGTSLQPEGNVDTVEQIIFVVNNSHGQKNIALRIKVEFMVGETRHQSMASVSGFPHLY